jgi:hypothetical protein
VPPKHTSPAVQLSKLPPSTSFTHRPDQVTSEVSPRSQHNLGSQHTAGRTHALCDGRCVCYGQTSTHIHDTTANSSWWRQSPIQFHMQIQTHFKPCRDSVPAHLPKLRTSSDVKLPPKSATSPAVNSWPCVMAVGGGGKAESVECGQGCTHGWVEQP